MVSYKTIDGGVKNVWYDLADSSQNKFDRSDLSKRIFYLAIASANRCYSDLPPHRAPALCHSDVGPRQYNLIIISFSIKE